MEDSEELPTVETFDRGEMSAAEICAALPEFLVAVSGQNEAVLQDARAAGVDLGELSRASDSVVVRERGAGVAGVGEAILVGLAVKMAGDFIEGVFVPWLKRRFGAKALGKRQGH